MMNDGMLSQDEIDALLKGDLPSEKANEIANLETDRYLSPMERDALGEIGNISMGSSTTALSVLLNQKVEITTPSVTIVERDALQQEFPKPFVIVEVSYTEGLEGSNLFVINTKDASVIANLMLGGDGIIENDNLDEIGLSAVQEAMNQMMGTAATSMSTVFQKRVDISPPSIDVLNLAMGEGVDKVPVGDPLVKVSFRMTIGSLIDSTIMQILPVSFAKELVQNLLNPEQDHVVETVQPASETVKVETTNISREHSPYGHPEISNVGRQVPVKQQPTNVQPAVFSNFQPMNVTELEAKNLDILYDIPLKVTVELGRTSRSVKDILELTSGSIIELDKLAGEPVDILVNNKLMAKGEVVVIDENFGVRVTDIVSKMDRVNNLK